MANRTVAEAKQVHGTNPQYLIEKITRSRIYDSLYWKEHCFALTAETIIDKAVSLNCIGGSYGGSQRPTEFLCLLLKMLQLQPEPDIVTEYISQKDFKYLRALGAYYLRLTRNSEEVYEVLEGLYTDYRKLRRRTPAGGFEIITVDAFIDELLRNERALDVQLPRIRKRSELEYEGKLDPRRSILEDELESGSESGSSRSRSRSRSGSRRSRRSGTSSRSRTRSPTPEAPAKMDTDEPERGRSPTRSPEPKRTVSPPKPRSPLPRSVSAAPKSREPEKERRVSPARRESPRRRSPFPRHRTPPRRRSPSRSRSRSRSRARNGTRDKDKSRVFRGRPDDGSRSRSRSRDRRRSRSRSRDRRRDSRDYRRRSRSRSRDRSYRRRDSRDRDRRDSRDRRDERPRERDRTPERRREPERRSPSPQTIPEPAQQVELPTIPTKAKPKFAKSKLDKLFKKNAGVMASAPSSSVPKADKGGDAEKGGDGSSASVEETNRMRAALGLKPLK